MEHSLKSNTNPLFEIKLELSEDKILFSPTIEPNDDSNFQKLILNLIDDIYKMGHHVPRVSEGRETVSDLVGLLYLVDFIKNLLEDAVKEAKVFAIEYEQYSYLWLDDKQEKLSELLIEFEAKKNAFLMLEKFKEE
ncbi:hypothetical protein ACFFRR_005999, partial [Megaselia abdita]